MWNSSMEPSGHMSLTYFFFVPLYSYWGCNNNSSSNHGQWLFFKIKRHAYAHSLRRAMPRDWLPGDIATAGNECARITSAKFIRKPEAPWYALHTCESCATQSLLTSSSTSWWNGATCGESPALIPSLSCSGDGDMQTAWWHAKAKLGFIVVPCLEPRVSKIIFLGL